MGCYGHLLLLRRGDHRVPKSSVLTPPYISLGGDVSISDDNSMKHVFLKRSKTDQFGRGVAVYLGATGVDLSPVAALSSYIALRGDLPGAFSARRKGQP